MAETKKTRELSPVESLERAEIANQVTSMLFSINDISDLAQGFEEGKARAQELSAFGASEIVAVEGSNQPNTDGLLGFTLGVYAQQSEEGTL